MKPKWLVRLITEPRRKINLCSQLYWLRYSIHCFKLQQFHYTIQKWLEKANNALQISAYINIRFFHGFKPINIYCDGFHFLGIDQTPKRRWSPRHKPYSKTQNIPWGNLFERQITGYAVYYISTLLKCENSNTLYLLSVRRNSSCSTHHVWK